MIDRKALVSRHNPVLNSVDTESPLSVGNGEFAFTADVTGMQSLYSAYNDAHAPLCTMSQWGWHTEPDGGKYYTLDELEPTRYKLGGRLYSYAVEPPEGGEAVYEWLRHNPHRLNLARIAFSYDGAELTAISGIRQELSLYDGILHSEFDVNGTHVSVVTAAAQSRDAVGFHIRSDALSDGRLSVKISFPYGSYRIGASDWHSPEKHRTSMLGGDGVLLLRRELDGDCYYAAISGDAEISRESEHVFSLKAAEMSFTVAFSPDNAAFERYSFDELLQDSRSGWARFWESGGAVSFEGSGDSRASELERRTVLSQYLTALHSSGSVPPQETGLACNSWYGKFHLEMHILHSGWFPLWGRPERLERSLGWYRRILDPARKNAARNGYSGARWPKMTGPGGTDSPSRIATLLIWQQPHLIYMLELIRRTKTDPVAFMREHWELVRETADFLADFARENPATGYYDLPPPLIPVQEEFPPEQVCNPCFELSYWRFGLKTASAWARALGMDCSTQWERISDSLAPLPVRDGVYTPFEGIDFNKCTRDHPSMLYALGFVPHSLADSAVMSATCDRVLKNWDFQSAWGWDFALMAMTLCRLGRHAEAVDILLKNTPKNSFVASGNNYQRGRTDLPLYLPGNGALLFALPLLLDCFQHGWRVEHEGISPEPGQCLQQCL